MIATPRAARVHPMLDFWKEEAAGFEARLNDVLAALDEAGVDPDDKLEEGDAVRALTAERDEARRERDEARAVRS
jgi:hypothetical protein